MSNATPRTAHTITTFAMAIALAFPCAVQSVGIGEAVLHSRLGEPLLVQIELTAASSERVDESCLFLSAPGPHEADSGGFLTKASLTLKTEGKRQYVAVSSHKPFNDAFARLRLQIKCPGAGSITKTLTILPDMDAPVPQAALAAPDTRAKINNIPAYRPADAHEPAAGRQQETHHDIAEPPARKELGPHNKRPPPVARSASKQGRPASFRLKLSGDPIDESRIGKISAEERMSLLAQQKLLDADDQTARFLALQHQVKQLQDELGEIKLQLAQLGAVPSAAASSAPAASAASPTAPSTGTQENRPRPAIAAELPPPRQGVPSGLLPALALLLAILALWQGLRYSTRIKSRSRIKLQQGEKSTPGPVTDIAAPQRMTPPVAARDTGAVSPHATTVMAAPGTNAAENKGAPRQPRATGRDATGEEAMLEEAELYAAHGRPAKSIEILQEIIKRRPSKTEAWTLLLSIYSSLGKAAEFENTAREFFKRHKDSPSWAGVQALGRTLDRNNPLYADKTTPTLASAAFPDAPDSSRLIGDILTGMGALSAQDLQNCLNEFDPKKHGRLGGYLVARKAITLAQLDQALLQQQGVSTETSLGTLPSLQDVENFLADFDPKRDGSVGEFLSSRHAVTPQQLNRLLRQHPNHGAAARASREPQPLRKAETLDFALEAGAELPALDLELEPGKDKPLDFEIESPSLAFPEINLDMAEKRQADKKPDPQ